MEKFELKSNQDSQSEGKEDLNSPENKRVINSKMNSLFNEAKNLKTKKWYLYEYDQKTWHGTIQAWQYKLTFDRKLREWYSKQKGLTTYYDYSNISLTLMPDINNDIDKPTLKWEFQTMEYFQEVVWKMKYFINMELKKQSWNDRYTREEENYQQEMQDIKLSAALNSL